MTFGNKLTLLHQTTHVYTRQVGVGFDVLERLVAFGFGRNSHPSLGSMGSAFGKIDVECAAYTVTRVLSKGMEVRLYAPCVAVETPCTALSKDNDGAFRRLAKYIGVFGTPQNSAAQAVAMTAPVINAPAAIAMTAPVVNQAGMMAFILPAAYQLVNQAPTPSDPAVTLRQVAARTLAANTFSGTATDAVAEQRAAELHAALVEHGVLPPGSVVPPFELARYNPPWTPSPFRKNEILMPVPAA